MIRRVSILSLAVGLFLFAAASFAEEKPTPIKVACVGDSITFGFGIKGRNTQSYPAQLAVALGDQWSVGNFGRNGATVLKKGHLPYWETPQYGAALAFTPDVVVIKLGTNDSRPKNWKRHKSDYVADYVDLIHTFQKLESKPTVWICYSAPVFPGLREFNDTVIRTELIPLVDEVAKKAGVEIIDIYSVLSGKKEMFPDKLHPNAAGAKLIAETVAMAITANKPPKAEQNKNSPDKQ